MLRNIEIKARVEDVEDLERRVAGLADGGPWSITQEDTFFACANGRLKLRQFSEEAGELIFYQRADEAGPKTSFYLRSPTSTPTTLRDCLKLAYGEAGRVRKQRTLFMLGRTRIHIDRVDGLGCFLELEVVLDEDEPTDCGIREAEDLLSRLDVDESQLVDAAYVDLASPKDV